MQCSPVYTRHKAGTARAFPWHIARIWWHAEAATAGGPAKGDNHSQLCPVPQADPTIFDSVLAKQPVPC